MESHFNHDHLRRRRTKIVATIGPASRDASVIESLIKAGVNVFRLNMSHGDHAGHAEVYHRVRSIAERMREHIAILADLCGPKIRVGKFEGGKIEIRTGERVVVTTRDVEGKPGLIPSQYHELAGDVVPGDRILLDDGLLELRVEKAEGTEIACVVVNGGVLKDRKGMNLPGVKVSAPSLTQKDREDAAFALKLGVDHLALSFVRRAEDVLELRKLADGLGIDTRIISKIEKPEAIENIEAILDASDGIMVARGDLGVELPPERVPIVQRELVHMARRKNRPVIVATQMMESMIENPRPTRAEVSDVSNAVFSGADAVMLSAETAAGKHPVEAVAMMDHVAREVEGWQWSVGSFGMLREDESGSTLSLNSSIARAAAGLSRDLHVRTIVVLSKSGATARVVSNARPASPVVTVTTEAVTARRANLLWGMASKVVAAHEMNDRVGLARRIARDFGMAEDGQYLLLISGFSHKNHESEPSLTVLRV